MARDMNLRANIPCLYIQEAAFETRPRYWLLWGFPWFASIHREKNVGWHLHWVATASFEVLSILSPEIGVLAASCNKPQNLLYTVLLENYADWSVWRYA